MGFNLGGIYKDAAEVFTGKKTADYLANQFGGATDGITDFIPGIGDAKATKEANAQNAKNAKAQMDFQERMSNSAYQRSMEDMKKAGLNPMLAMSQGGASTPSGAMATANPVTRTKLGEFAMNAATGIAGASVQHKLAENTVADSQQNRQLSATQTAKNIADTERIRVETQKAKKDLPAAQLKHDITEKGSKIIRNLWDRVQNSADSFRQSNFNKNGETFEKAIREMRQREKLKKGN